MEHTEPTGEAFEVRSDFDAAQFFEHSFGISKMTDAPRDVRVRCNRLEYEYLLASPVHASQQLIQVNEGTFELSLHVLITFELIQFLLGLGPAIEVLAPSDLRDQMKSALSDSLKKYN